MLQAPIRLQRWCEWMSSLHGSRLTAVQVFILGVNFHEMKLVKVRSLSRLSVSGLHDQKALESFYAIGPQTSSRILAKFSIHPRAKMGTLPAKAVTGLTAELSNMTIENDARRVVQDNIKRPARDGHVPRQAPCHGPAGARPAHTHTDLDSAEAEPVGTEVDCTNTI